MLFCDFHVHPKFAGTLLTMSFRLTSGDERETVPPSEKQNLLIANVDGGARGNPGPAGYGVFIEDEAGHPVAELSEYLGHKTNNFAEYSGLLAALGYALKHGARALLHHQL
jgi:hypothetical protein